MTRQLKLTIIIALSTATCIGQNCSCISGTKNKETGIKSEGGITNSKDFYSLLIQKETDDKDSAVAPKYYLLLNAASGIVLPDSMVNSKRTLELLLTDNSKLYVENAKCFNNQMPFGFCIAFSASLTREQLENISKTPIVTFTAVGILTTSFTEKKQREIQTIASCLLTGNNWRK